MKRLTLSVISLFFILMAYNSALGCLCFGPDSPKKALKDWSEAVFSGEITASEKQEIGALFTIKVDRVWKGNLEKTVILYDSAYGSSCTAGLEVGKRFIISASYKDLEGKFLSLDKDGKPRLSVDDCSWSADIGNPKNYKWFVKKIGKGITVN